MFCQNCGSPVGEGEKFCRNCGAKIETIPTPAPVYEAPEKEEKIAGSYSAPVYEAPKTVEPAAPVEAMPNTTLWIILGAVSLFFCCIPGIVSLIFAIKASTCVSANNIAGANKDIKAAKIWFWVSIGLGVASGILGFIGGIAQAGMYY